MGRAETSGLDRRSLLRAAGGALVAAPFIARAGFAFGQDNPFTLGVASGDPLPDGFVIWTRLAPQPLAPDGRGGLHEGDAFPVGWEVAADEQFRHIVKLGQVMARSDSAHSVHVEVTGLAPNRPYWYRFHAMGGAESMTGRAATSPRPGERLARMKIAVASCSNYEMGYFAAYGHMAREQPDLAVFLGDYIYENNRQGGVRHHPWPGEVVDLAGYRHRYALHKTDADLQALHAAAPSLITWDDHEVSNDYANRWAANPAIAEADFLVRRAAAYQAFWEHMPLRRASAPHGPDMRMYKRRRYGDLAEFLVLDGRQHRDMQPCPTPTNRGGRFVTDAGCANLNDASRSMLGRPQEAWLADSFRRASARWTIIAQDLLVAPLAETDPATHQVVHDTDGWDGYPASRERMLAALAGSRAPNPVFLGGDIHSFWVTDLKADFADPASRTIATEFVGTSITSNGPPYELVMAALPANPHVKFFDGRQRGYLAIDIEPRHLTARLQVTSDRGDPHATLSTLRTFVVQDGRPGAVAA